MVLFMPVYFLPGRRRRAVEPPSLYLSTRHSHPCLLDACHPLFCHATPPPPTPHALLPFPTVSPAFSTMAVLCLLLPTTHASSATHTCFSDPSPYLSHYLQELKGGISWEQGGLGGTGGPFSKEKFTLPIFILTPAIYSSTWDIAAVEVVNYLMPVLKKKA